MARPRDPLVFPALCFSAGVLASAFLNLDSGPLLAGTGLCLCLALIPSRVRYAAGMAAMLLAGAAAFSYHRPPPDPELDAYDAETLIVAGCVVEPGAADHGRTQFVVELEPGARMRVTLNTRDGERIPHVAYGTLVEVEARVRKPRNFANPGAFDYVNYLRREGIFWTASARGAGALRIIPGSCGNPVRAAAFATRGWISARLRHLYAGDNYAARLAPALLVGDNSALERSSTEDFRRTGTYHALVVSGLHITVVAGFALLLLRLAGLPLGFTLPTAAALSWAYAAVACFQPPVLRSAAGFTLFLIGRWFFRKGRLLNLLSATAILFLALDPQQLFEPSFQLTFLSVIAIGAIASPLIDRSFGPYRCSAPELLNADRDMGIPPRVAQFRIEMRLLAETAACLCRVPASLLLRFLALLLRVAFWVAEMVAISAAVQLCLVLGMIAYFHQFPLTSVLANVFVVPALTFAVPIALAAAVTGSHWLALMSRVLISIGEYTAAWWSGLEPFLRIPDPPPLAALATAICVCLLAVCCYRAVNKALIAVSGTAALGCCAVLVVYPFAPIGGKDSLEVTAVDVGQGESLLVGFPGGDFLLVDGGGIPSFGKNPIQPKLDIGEDVVSPYLWRRRIRRLRAVVATHLHDDHVGGLPAIIRNFRPEELWTGTAVDSPAWRSLLAAASAAGTRVINMHQGDSRRFERVHIQALAPASDYAPGRAPSNDDSLVLLLSLSERRVLLTGDAGPHVEQRMLESGLLGEVDLLKVAHHGSRASTRPEMLDATRPLFGFISAGAGNLYGHPNPELLSRLWGAGARVYRTDAGGLVTFRTDGHRVRIEAPGGDTVQAFAEKLSY